MLQRNSIPKVHARTVHHSSSPISRSFISFKFFVQMKHNPFSNWKTCTAADWKVRIEGSPSVAGMCADTCVSKYPYIESRSISPRKFGHYLLFHSKYSIKLSISSQKFSLNPRCVLCMYSCLTIHNATWGLPEDLIAIYMINVWQREYTMYTTSWN